MKGRVGGGLGWGGGQNKRVARRFLLNLINVGVKIKGREGGDNPLISVKNDKRGKKSKK